MFLSDISVKRPVLTTVILLIVAIFGAASYVQLGVELFPDIEFPIIVVTTTYLGAGPEEVERVITKPIEDSITLVDNVKYVESTSAEGASSVIIRLNMGADLDVAADDVRAQVDRIRRDLPDDAEDPIVIKLDPNAFPVLRLAVSGDLPLKDIYRIADTDVRTELGKIEGVGLINVVGGEKREIRVEVNRKRLDAHHVSVDQVIAAVSGANMEIPGGHITRKSREYVLRVLGEIDEVSALEDVGIPGTEGRIRIGDVATVEDTIAEIREVARTDELPSVGVEILKKSDANTILVGRNVREAVTRLNEGALRGVVRIQIITDDSVFIRDVVTEVRDNMWQAILLTALALYIFLHDFRGTIVTAMAMPTSVIATFTLLFFAGYTVNMMSMMGLAISVGILVNNAILVLENIHRYLDLGEDPKSAAMKGTGEIALAVSSTTLTNIVVFLPIAFMQSIVGQIFRQFAMTVVFATVFSLFISLTLTPMAAALLFRSREQQERTFSERTKRIYKKWDGLYEDLAGTYERLVRRVLRHPWITLLTAALLFFGVMGTIPKIIGKEFFPNVDEGTFSVDVETDVSSSLGYTDAVTRQVEKICGHIPEVEKMYSTVGTASGERLGGSSSAVNIAQVVVQLVDQSERERTTQQVMDAVRPRLAGIVGAKFTVQASEQGGPQTRPIELEIRGDDIDVLNEIASRVLTIVKGGVYAGKTYEPVQGLVDVQSDWREGKPEISLIPQRERLRKHGVTIEQVAETMRAYYSGVVASEYREGDDEYDIRVQLRKDQREKIGEIENLAVQAADGGLVKVGELVQRVRSAGPTQLRRKDREHMVRVVGGTSGRTSGEVYQDIRDRLKDIHLPKGYRFSWAGEIEFMQENFRDLYTAMLLAVVLTYLMLAGLLESWRLSILIMLSLPVAFIGVFIALLVGHATINVFSLMGMVMLIGLVINNSIVIMDYIGVVRKEGMALKDAIARACAVRLRPILMANITTVVAMIPLALGIGAGGEYRAPMAATQMGGIISGGLLALVIAPALYYISERRREKKTTA